jgi:hypothetical protein
MTSRVIDDRELDRGSPRAGADAKPVASVLTTKSPSFVDDASLRRTLRVNEPASNGLGMPLNLRESPPFSQRPAAITGHKPPAGHGFAGRASEIGKPFGLRKPRPARGSH